MIMTAATISFGNWLLEKIKDKGFDQLYSKLTSSEKIDKTFINAVNNVSERLQKKYPYILGGKIEYFFKNEVVFQELIKLIFINSNVDIEIVSKNFDTETLPPNFILEFITDLKNELLKDREIEKIISDKELFFLFNGISNDIEIISKNSTLTINELNEIRKSLDKRIGGKFIFEKFKEIYSKNVITNLSNVNFLGLSVDVTVKRNTKKLNDVYVKPNFKITDMTYLKCNNIEINPFTEEHELNYNKIFDFSNKIIVLGDPGSGKSILIKSIICNILNNNSKEFNLEDILNYLPFRIELRKYLVYKKQFRGNILKYLNSLLEEEYGILNMTEKILNEILTDKKTILFFDGLDEIFKAEDKIEIKNDIENFHNTYSNAKSITTSRKIGYEEAMLDNEKFCEFVIQDFNENQIEEYVNKWYEKEENDEEIRDREIIGFISKMNEIDDELISNPLLLSLIVIIYRNTLKLPESKLEIYHSCTKTLVDKWDASKDLVININPLIYRNKEKILADLAFWQYKELSSEEIKITYDKAIKTVVKTIEEKFNITDIEEATNFAENFMEYAQKRSIYFDNNFTHKTFLEYYSAYWIYSNIEKKNKTDDRNIIISKYIHNPFWHIVLELLLNMIDNDQADCEIMDELLTSQLKTIDSLPFILSTLNSFKNVSDNFIETTINLTLDFLFKDYTKFDQINPDSESLQSKVYEILKNIYGSSINIKRIVLNRLKDMEKSDVYRRLAYILYMEMDLMNHFNENLENVFCLDDKEKFNQELLNDKYLFIVNCYTFDAKHEGFMFIEKIQEFIRLFGFDELFVNSHSYFDKYFLDGFVSYFISNQIKSENLKSIKNNIELVFNTEKKFIKLIEFTNETHYLFYYHSNIYDLIEIYDESEDKRISCFLLLVIIKILDFRNSIENETIFKDKINKLNKSNDLKQILKINTHHRGSKIINIYKKNSMDF